jgi:hypothetical protein
MPDEKPDEIPVGAIAEGEVSSFAFPAQVMAPETRAKSGSSDEELLSLAKAQASDPSIFDEFPPALFSAVVSTNALDSYYTQMHKSSLTNFAADLNTGVSLQDSHSTFRLASNLGYSLRGRYVGAGGNGVQRAIGDFYSVPSDPETIAFVNKMRAGTVRDVSVGFYLGDNGRYVCDLCGNDVMSRSCSHYPGMLYPSSEKEGATMVRATATIHDARLSEVSAVYDGATPGAGILKARRAAAEGTLLPDTARLLEIQYRIALPAARHTWAGADLDSKENAMPNKAVAAGADGQPITEEQVRATLQDAKWSLGSDLLTSLRELAEGAHRSAAHEKRANDAEKERDALKAETERLAPLADDGKVYRADLIEEVVTEGVRAFGNAFPAETERLVLASATIEQIKAKRDFNKSLAVQTLQGGRVTTDPDSNQHARQDAPPATPNAAYRA